MQYSSGFAVTPSDTVDIRPNVVSDALYIGGAGNLSVVMADGQTTALAGVPVGTILPIRVTRVRATGTTATNIVALKR
jgi:hypothetical protein